ncbi:MAG: hypothetical protein F6J86_03150 [Symploca sp. SIO1B1]|nr:hypothetical protein [Symploca sp. SIO1C2]NER48675.1 hypothetical protein [Symploca sp. SIO1A3]NER92846.1 hypothetical protein [Symploca sp. SIO1B1]
MSSTTPLKLNLADGSVSFSFTASAAGDLKNAITEFMQSLKAATQASGSGGKPSLQKPMEYQFSGEVFLEVFCNPNIYASPFAAKVLITLRDDRIRLSTEAELTRLIDDLNEYLEQAG